MTLHHEEWIHLHGCWQSTVCFLFCFNGGACNRFADQPNERPARDYNLLLYPCSLQINCFLNANTPQLIIMFSHRMQRLFNSPLMKILLANMYSYYCPSFPEISSLYKNIRANQQTTYLAIYIEVMTVMLRQ